MDNQLYLFIYLQIIADSSEDESPQPVKKQTTTVPINLGHNGDIDSETETKQEYRDVSRLFLGCYKSVSNFSELRWAYCLAY